MPSPLRSARRRPMARPTANPIDAPGTGESAWRRWPGLTRLPAQDVTAWTSAVVLAAHPDDEVLGVGGTISVLAAAGVRLRLIAVTDGESSHPGHSDPPGLARRRAQERAAALLALGAGDAEIVRLGLPDSGLRGRESDLAARLQDLVTGFDVCLAPWEADVHADHEAVGRAARLVSGQAFFYPIWMWHWARPADSRVPWPQAVRVPLTPAVADRKQAAIGCFGSQLEARPAAGVPVLSEAFVAHFTRDYEVLFPVIRS
jgi:LmbE family N-acetylglucosaminyl deacetylase